MERLIFSLVFTLLPFTSIQAQQISLPQNDRIRIAETFRLAELLQDSLWKGWSKAPFALLLVTPKHEFLIRHPEPSEDFKSIGYDSLLHSMVYVRKRVYSPGLLASFPAVGSVSTIVIGQPKYTGKPSTFWVLTALHEHFHQMQSSQPDYYSAVNALNLSGDDKTGMWMLNYPFPYDSAAVSQSFVKWSTALLRILQSTGTANFDRNLPIYLKARAKFRNMLADNDYSYLSFQLWQEGIARYTEYKMAKAAMKYYTPTKAFRSLKDFIPFARAADTLYKNIIQELSELSLKKQQRTAFYSIGAAEALLLDIVNPKWKQQYFAAKFDLMKLYFMRGDD